MGSSAHAESLPDEWRGVLFVSGVIGAEALALFWILFKATK